MESVLKDFAASTNVCCTLCGCDVWLPQAKTWQTPLAGAPQPLCRFERLSHGPGMAGIGQHFRTETARKVSEQRYYSVLLRGLLTLWITYLELQSPLLDQHVRDLATFSFLPTHRSITSASLLPLGNVYMSPTEVSIWLWGFCFVCSFFVFAVFFACTSILCLFPDYVFFLMFYFMLDYTNIQMKFLFDKRYISASVHFSFPLGAAKIGKT